MQQDRRGSRGSGQHPEHVRGQIIVKFKRDAAETAATALAAVPTTRRGARASISALPDAIQEPMAILRAAGVTVSEPLFVDDDAAPRRGRRSALATTADSMPQVLARTAREPARETLRGFQLVEVRSSSTANVIARLKRSRAVEIVEPVPNHWPAIKHTNGAAKRVRNSTLADPMSNRQWGLRAIRWFDKDRPDSSEVDVAILDSGIDAGHPELSDAIASYNYGANGKADKLGHGTHVAGIIAAAANNGIGITGIARCRLHCWKIFTDPATGSSDAGFDFKFYSTALNNVLKDNTKVVNLSIGGTAHSQTEAILFSELADAGVIVAAAMGNEYDEGDPIEYPAAYDGVIAVGAIDEADRRAEFSCTGKHIKVVAPGVNILSTVPQTKAIFASQKEYDSWPGTSMATPHVAGCAALLYANIPRTKANRDKIEAKLISKAKKLPGMKGKKFTDEYGFGLIDLANML